MEIMLGVVENNVDPLKIGRCQVRVFGLHTDNRDAYPTADLPWAALLVQMSAVSGQGEVFVPNQGDWVAISFVDPEMQVPLILGVVPKYVSALPDFEAGFSDPAQLHPDSGYVSESGISRLARNENVDQTIIQDKKDNRTTGVQCNAVSWDEPETPYASVYPQNRVINTKHHVIELDDTDGVERIHIYHKSGTSMEVHPNGDKVELVKAKRYLVVTSDNDVLMKGNYNIRIEGAVNKEIVGNENKKVGGVIDKQITGDLTETVGGDVLINASGSAELRAGTSATLKSGTSALVDGGTTAEVKSGTTLTIDGGTSVTINAGSGVTVSASGNAEISAGGNVSISAGGTVTVSGALISLN